jgi:hypothetical protein
MAFMSPLYKLSLLQKVFCTEAALRRNMSVMWLVGMGAGTESCRQDVECLVITRL